MTNHASRGAASLLLGLAALSWSPGRASAELGPVQPELLRAQARLRSAPPAEAYAALRDVWRLWDTTDPAHVEDAVTSYGLDSGTTPPLRVYAGLLGAFARRRRGDISTALTRVQGLGFVSKWLTIGPFDDENRAGFARAFGPELSLRDPLDPAKGYDGKERVVRWRAPPSDTAFGWLDLGASIRPRESACAYAATFVRAKAGTRAPRTATLWLGAAGSFKVFWNGEKVLEDPGYRELDIDRFSVPVVLGRGRSRITVKVCSSESPKFALRIADEVGAPDLGVDVEAAFSLAAEGSVAAKVAPRAFGPMQAFEKEVTGKDPRPHALEAFARYLLTTGGDSKQEHRARDLARRAAESEPTAARLLLAAQLTEDRNQEREWIDRALAVASPRDTDVLLAQARLVRGGTNFRDAVPLFEKVLAIDPDHTAATLGLVELYVEAGLKRMAATTLETALARRPHTLALLRAYADQLRSLQRDAEAAEIEGTYSGFRFDDTAFVTQQIDLALRRRDRDGAVRWLARFQSAEPDSTWARSIAAHTYRGLGDVPKALAQYQQGAAIAPEDVGTLRAISDLYGEQGRPDDQLRLLRQILSLSPQAKDVREYVEHIEPAKPRADEAYAWDASRFLPLRDDPDRRYPKRTLRNLTVTTVFPNGLASRFRQVVFQPLTDEAAAAAREYAVDYQADKQTLTLRAAKVYRKDGKIDESYETGESNANNPAIATYTSTRTFYVRFSRLNPGDLVELRYRIEDVAPRNEIADYFGEVEYLGSDEPIANSEYVLIANKARNINFNASSVPQAKHETIEQGEHRVHRFFVDRLLPIAPEPVMPPWAEVVPHVHASTFKTWDEVGAWYWGLARDQFDVDDEVRKRVQEITKGKKDAASKVRAIYKYVTELRYVALEFGLEGLRPRRSALTLARGWGDCKDKATLLVTMLREVGIPATIVIVRTGMRGNIEPDPASLAPFDHAIAYVPSLDVYLDGTAEHTGTTELPPMDRGAFALQINEGHPRLVRLPEPPPDASVIRRKFEVTLVPDGAAQVSVEMSVTGAYAPDWRRRYLAESTRRERARVDLAQEFGAIELAAGKAGLDVGDLDDAEVPVLLRARGRLASFGRHDERTLVLPAGSVQHLAADYASLSKRTQDIDLRALSRREDEWTFRLPAGSHVIEPPSARSVDTPFGHVALTFEESAGRAILRTSLSFKKSRIHPSEYDAFRTFCEAADRVFGQRMVIGGVASAAVP